MRAIKKDSHGKSQILIQVYDIEKELGREIELNLSILNLEGMSQININNQLYLLGSNTPDNHHEGSRFITVDPLKEPACFSYLISSSHCHYYPSITQYKNEYIIVVGGKNSLKCEIFNIKRCKWMDLVDLPEERYGAVIAVDELALCLYVFGGYNSTSKRIHTSVLKLNIKLGRMDKWDTIVTVSNSSVLLTKCYATVCKLEKNKILIIGGQTNQEESCDDVIEVTFNKGSLVVSSKFKISESTVFNTINYACEMNGSYYMIDNQAMIHQVSRFDQTHKCSSFFDFSWDQVLNYKTPTTN